MIFYICFEVGIIKRWRNLPCFFVKQSIGEKTCVILPVFHSLTGSDFTKPFFGRSKTNSFKKLLSKPEYGFNVIHEYWSCWYWGSNVFCVHVIYNRPKWEKSPVAMRSCMLEKTKKKVCTYKITAARSKVLNYENIASTFV